MITKRDVWITLILSIGSLGISVGVIGIKSLFVTILFFIVPFTTILLMFFTFKPKNPKRHYDKER